MFHGLLIKESLRDGAVLERLIVTKEETWDIDNAADGQPAVWHVAWFDVSSDNVGDVATALSNTLDDGKWFLELSDDTTMLVVFQGKVFRYTKGDAAARREAQAYGRRLGIAENQLDWKE